MFPSVMAPGRAHKGNSKMRTKVASGRPLQNPFFALRMAFSRAHHAQGAPCSVPIRGHQAKQENHLSTTPPSPHPMLHIPSTNPKQQSNRWGPTLKTLGEAFCQESIPSTAQIQHPCPLADACMTCTAYNQNCAIFKRFLHSCHSTW